MMGFLFSRKENISGEINNGSKDVARKRLLNSINSERTHLTPIVTEMMQHDIKRVIEAYLGNDLDSDELVIEIKNPDYSAFVCDVNLNKTEISENRKNEKSDETDFSLTEESLTV